MNKDLTEIVFILDESGSMSGLEADTIGGFNSMLRKQQAESGSAFVTTVFFSDTANTVHDRVKIADTPDLTAKDYCPHGCTALLDTIGNTIQHIETIHKYVRDEDVPAQTIFIITTDGMENASRKFTRSDIRELIEKKKSENWDFIFLGANIDAIATAESFGIDRDYAVDYKCDSTGTQVNFCCIDNAISQKRATGKIKKVWKEEAERDFSKRKN